MINTIVGFFNKEKSNVKEQNIVMSNLGVKKYKSFGEFNSLAKFILRLHQCSCSGEVNVYLTKISGVWSWQIEAENMPQEQMLCFKDNLEQLDLSNAHNQKMIETQLSGKNSFLFFTTNKSNH